MFILPVMTSHLSPSVLHPRCFISRCTGVRFSPPSRPLRRAALIGSSRSICLSRCPPPLPRVLTVLTPPVLLLGDYVLRLTLASSPGRGQWISACRAVCGVRERGNIIQSGPSAGTRGHAHSRRRSGAAASASAMEIKQTVSQQRYHSTATAHTHCTLHPAHSPHLSSPSCALPAPLRLLSVSPPRL